MASVSPHKQEMEGKAITSLLLLGNKCGAYLELVMKSFCIKQFWFLNLIKYLCSAEYLKGQPYMCPFVNWFGDEFLGVASLQP